MASGASTINGNDKPKRICAMKVLKPTRRAGKKLLPPQSPVNPTNAADQCNEEKVG